MRSSSSLPLALGVITALASAAPTSGIQRPTAEPSGRFPVGAFRSGNATVFFAADGTLRENVSTASWDGRYRTHADTAWLSDRSPACAAAGEGRYRWAFDGSRLSLTALDDPCEPRLASWMHPWQRVVAGHAGGLAQIPFDRRIGT